MLKLDVMSGGVAGQSKSFESAPVRIGSLAASELCIAAPGVARVHAMVEGGTDDGFQLVDMGSASGTFVNGQRIVKHQLKNGDVIKIGDTEISVSIAPGGSKVSSPSQKNTTVAAAAASKNYNPFAKRIKKKVNRNNFERRFLSEYYKSGTPILEVALFWKNNIIGLNQYEGKEGIVTIGAAPVADFMVSSADVSFIRPIAVYRGNDEWDLILCDWMEGIVLVDPDTNDGKDRMSVKDACAVLGATPEPLPVNHKLMKSADTGGELKKTLSESRAIRVKPKTRLKLSIGDAHVLIHLTSKSLVPFPIFAPATSGSLSTTLSYAASVFVHVLFLLLLLFTTDRVDAFSIDSMMNASRFAEALISAEEKAPEEEEKIEEEQEAVDDEPADENSDVVEVGNKPTLSEAESNVGVTGLTKEQNTAAAMSAGLLAQANAMNSLIGSAMTAESFDAIDNWGSFSDDAAAGANSYGLSMMGAGSGGGGSMAGGFSGGAIGTLGGKGSVGPRDYGQGVANTGERKKASLKLTIDKGTVTGSIDARLIRKVINQHKREIRACYEKELLKKKGLNGRIGITWFIDAAGSVTSASIQSTTMNDPNVESCLVNAIKYWRFPKPSGGSVVKVNYPFVFEIGSSGE